MMKSVTDNFPSLNVIILFYLMFLPTNSSEIQYRTKWASEKHHDLWCYRCDTMVDGESCLDLHGNYSWMNMKCSKEQKKCQVRRISMSTSTDEITGKPKLWLLQRNCSESCEPGCIVIGERTKLHSCITCCDENNFCNSGSLANVFHLSSLALASALIHIIYRISSESLISNFILSLK
ncbi:uncharacterized protein LOC123316110 isoform X1 [Coccinella septempunctata]|uniref:uncharacterized protein LOC123316110 isoform X1 n=1 Tax=Coccinella septempunctata TaxID=41139 RepID=UPI001D0993D0|nr:uncharacterized protein LOC123316110 isoform X1 [Coccinella septempunctata]